MRTYEGEVLLEALVHSPWPHILSGSDHLLLLEADPKRNQRTVLSSG